jgi:hypothetical protein
LSSVSRRRGRKAARVLDKRRRDLGQSAFVPERQTPLQPQERVAPTIYQTEEVSCSPW